MSKLAHSNEETMYEIEMQYRGMTKIKPTVKPKCEEIVKRPIWLNDNTPCRKYARYIAEDGKKLCQAHAETYEL